MDDLCYDFEEFAEYLKMNIFYNYNNIFKPMGIYVWFALPLVVSIEINVPTSQISPIHFKPNDLKFLT